MLIPIIFIIALTLTLATALLENGLTAAKTTLNGTVARYSDAAIYDGVATFSAALAGFVAQHGSSGPWPGAMSHSYPKSLCDPAVELEQCPFSYTVNGKITDVAAAEPARPQDAASNVQTSVIGEQRISAIVSVTVSARTGIILGTRTRLLTYRVFEVAPYAIVSGSRDTTTVDGSRATAQGDSGGQVAESQPASPATGTIGDTRIHVQLTCSTVIQNVVPFRNDQQAAGNRGLPWGNSAGAAHETPCHQSTSSVDAFSDKTWTNGNANASGWTQ